MAGFWETAAEIGAKVLLWQVQHLGTDALNSGILDELHFDSEADGTGGRKTELRTRAREPAFTGPT